MIKKLKKQGKRGAILLLSLGIVAGIAVCLLINGYVKLTAEKKITSAEKLEELKNAAEKPDAVLVLGAQVKPDKTPSKMLQERLDMGIALYKAGIADRIIMSGDHAEDDYDEVNVMKDYAIEKGVPSECIFMDHAGLSTYESMYRAKEIFQAENVIVVTQEYHLYRAVYDAEALGLKAQGVACDTAVYSGDKYRKLREVLARVKDVGYTIMKPEPTYMGDVIALSESGDVTNDRHN